MVVSLPDLKRDARTTGIFLDFDGTLSNIVDMPSQARPVDGAAELLPVLARIYRTVTIVSGRSAHQLLDWLGPELDIWGLHGAERVIDGVVTLSPMASPYVDLMQTVLEEATRAVAELDHPGVMIEDKGVMVGLHFRAAGDQLQAQRCLDELAARLAQEHGLRRAGGRMAFELRPPIQVSKKDVILQVAREAHLTAVLFAGDDRVDLPAFDALDQLEEEGVGVVRVGVESDEAPPELTQRADMAVPGPAGMVELLRRLL